MPVAQNLGPEAEWRRVLRHFGIPSDFTTMLRELGPDEARWIIEHEHEVYAGWNDRRREFLLDNFAQHKLKRPRGPAKTTVPPIQRHSTEVYGEKVG